MGGSSFGFSILSRGELFFYFNAILTQNKNYQPKFHTYDISLYLLYTVRVNSSRTALFKLAEYCNPSTACLVRFVYHVV
jgi:hypothetical protein